MRVSLHNERNDGVITFEDLASAHRWLQERNLHAGADFLNEDGDRVIEYWATSEQAVAEQSVSAPYCIVVSIPNDAACPQCGARPERISCCRGGIGAALTNCGHMVQPRPIAAGRADGTDSGRTYCGECACS